MQKTTLLAILQQCEYEVPRWQKWFAQHHDDERAVAPPHWTAKLKLIHFLSSCFFFLPSITGIRLALALISPGEWLIRQTYLIRAGWKLWWLKWQGLTVVAIAGSYAKTSTKHILHHTLSGEISTLVTPKSINTPLGIAQVILRDLTPSHRLFVVELGEYYPGDIRRLAHFVKPHFGIITPVGRQHLERMGTVETIAKTIGELIVHFGKRTNRVLVADQNQAFFADQPLTYYGTQPFAPYRIINAQVSRAGTEFEILDHVSNRTAKAFSPLFGEHQAVNTLPSIWVASQLKLNLDQVVKRISTLPYIERRHQPTFATHNVLVLDNSYNTNPESALESLKLLNQLQPSQRFVVTLGFTELGAASDEIHFAFGQALAQQTDYVGLIEAPWTPKIQAGFKAAGGNLDKIVVGQTQDEAWHQLQSFVTPNSIVLFEGGFQEMYI